MSVRKRNFPDVLQTNVLNDATGNFAAVAAVSGKKIVIWRIILTAPTAHTLTFEDGSTPLTGPMSTTLFPFNLEPQIDQLGCYALFETTVGNAFNIVADTGIQVSGIVYYTLE